MILKPSEKMLLFLAVVLTASGQQPAPRGTATDVGSAEVQATLRKTASSALSDQQLRVVDVDGEYNVGIGVVHRAKASGTGNALTHSQITEIYHMISGSATLVTGGALQNAKPTPADSVVVKVLNGPSSSGSTILNGVARQIGPGDVVVIPPNTPHWFSAIESDEIVYLVVRMDPHKVLPAGYDKRRAP